MSKKSHIFLVSFNSARQSSQWGAHICNLALIAIIILHFTLALYFKVASWLATGFQIAVYGALVLLGQASNEEC